MDSRTHDAIPRPTVVTAREHLEEVVADLKGTTRLAVDTESNGFYAYRERVCLIQLSSPEADYIVDPLAVRDISSLGPLLENPSIEKIFHAGEYDILCLKRDYAFRFANLFDTMIAARLLGCKELGLAATIERHFGVKLSKKLQRADWGKRPMSEEQIRYAQMDTHYLLRLADMQKELLREKGRLEDAAEAFEALATLTPVERVFDPEGYRKLAARGDLCGEKLSVLREIYLYREEQAQARDRAVFRVIPDEVMLRVAEALPQEHGELARVRGMTPYLMEKFGRGLLECVERGRRAGPPPQPAHAARRARADMREVKLFEELRQWRKKQAASEGVEPVVIVSSEILREIARLSCARDADPLKPLSALKRRRYAAAIQSLLSSKASPSS